MLRVICYINPDHQITISSIFLTGYRLMSGVWVNYKVPAAKVQGVIIEVRSEICCEWSAT